jgi:hypothetical protein
MSRPDDAAVAMQTHLRQLLCGWVVLHRVEAREGLQALAVELVNFLEGNGLTADDALCAFVAAHDATHVPWSLQLVTAVHLEPDGSHS